jgi:UbiD family decarboxylase
MGILPMEDSYLGGASVKLFVPIFKMNFPEIVDIALPAEGPFHRKTESAPPFYRRARVGDGV